MKNIFNVVSLAIFFIVYKISGMIAATWAMLGVSIVGLVVSYFFYEKKLNKVLLFSTILLAVSLVSTLMSGSLMYIKLKPTIFYAVFAIILFLTGYGGKVPAMKHAFGEMFTLKNDIYWKKLNTSFALFFIVMAIMNEIVWRNFSDDIWVKFKIFGVLPLTLVFTILHVPFLKKYSMSKSKSSVRPGLEQEHDT